MKITFFKEFIYNCNDQCQLKSKLVKPQDPFDSQINKNIDDFENQDSRIDKECFNHVNKESITSQKNK